MLAKILSSLFPFWGLTGKTEAAAKRRRYMTMIPHGVMKMIPLKDLILSTR
jgi:hypothetical protein